VLHSRVALVGAVHEIAIAAVDTVSAAAAEEADADALVRLPAWTPSPIASIRPTASWPGTRGHSIGNIPRRRGIGMAHAAGFDADADMTAGGSSNGFSVNSNLPGLTPAPRDRSQHPA